MTAPRPKGTKRADRRALVDAGKRYHAAKLEHLHTWRDPEDVSTPALRRYHEACFDIAVRDGLFALERYSVGPRKSSVAFAHKHYAKSKKGAK